MALKLKRGDKTKICPLAKDLLNFSNSAYGVDRPQEFILKAAGAMAVTLTAIQHDECVPRD